MAADKKNSTYRILVVDDNTSIHDDFRKILQKSISSGDNLKDLEFEFFGSEVETPASAVFEIDCASQGREGLEMALQAKTEGRPYAVAFVDGRMPPGWDGIETISHLWKKCSDLQVVLCTAYADYSWQEIRRVLGESDSLLILKKPFDNVEVLQLAHALTRKWELNREVQNRIENLDDMVRQRTEEKDRTRALLEAALEHSPAGIIISNANGNEILWTNRAAVAICGSDPVSPTPGGVNARCAFFQTTRADCTTRRREDLPLLRAVLKGEIIHEEEVFLLNVQGRDKWISYNAAPIRDADGKIIAGIVIFHDISDRKRSEKEKEKLQAQLGQIQKMESVGLLAGGVAHDHNNTMGVIMGNVELGMMEVDPSDPVYKNLKDIKKAAKRSADLTRQLLAFARRQTVTPNVLDLNRKISDMLNMLHRLIGEDIDLLWRPGKELWPVKIDPSQIDQILLNLCINARDAINGVGKITIETGNITFDKSDVSARPELRGLEYAAFTVTDSGRGMEKELFDRIFEPFFTTKEMGKGTGLGLATVYGIIRQNEGFIHVDSEVGKGSVFTVYLPRCEGEIRGPAVEKPDIKKGGQGEKVLLVEDDESILYLSRTMLEKLGYAVLVVNRPEEAFRQAENSDDEIELLITDVIMPKMNGRDLAAKLQSLYPSLKCLFMSGYTADIIAERGILDEGVNFIQKPFSMKDLATKVREVLDSK